MDAQSFLQSLPTPSILVICFLFCSWFCYQFSLFNKREKNNSSIPTNWPVLGMLPAIIQNAHRIHDYGTQVLIESGGTFEFKGPWFANVDFVVTCDPANIHYIFSKNFPNYPKGPEFRKMFDILGDGIFNADYEMWEIHRKVTLSIFHQPDYQKLLEVTVREKVANGLLPVLESFSKQGAEIDLQDILQRLTFDCFSVLLLDYDPESLCLKLPHIRAQYAFLDAEKAIFQRHILPESCWKLQKWLDFGKERKLREAWDDLDGFIYTCLEKKLEKLTSDTSPTNRGRKYEFDNGLNAFIQAYKSTSLNLSSSSNTNLPIVTKLFLRDVFLSLMVAGRDTVSTALAWFFFLLSKNPSVEENILLEIKTKLPFKHCRRDDDLHSLNQPICNISQSQKLVYLHGALCETLRLFPPVALEHKEPIKDDVLPSGNLVDANTKFILFFYSTGRMESIWGKDCLEFKPERWITKQGGIRHEPSFNFPAFNAGPRTCLGKEIAFVMMKIAAASVIYNFHVHVVEDHHICPSDSVIIQMEHGLKVKIEKRN